MDARAPAGFLSAQELTRRAAREVERELGLTQAFIYETDVRREALHLVGLVGTVQDRIDRAWEDASYLPLRANPHLAYAIESEAPLLIRDAQRDPQIDDHRRVRELAVVTLVYVPFVLPDGGAGVFGVSTDESEGPRDLNEDELDYLVMLTQAVANRLAGLRLEQEREQQASHHRRFQEQLLGDQERANLGAIAPVLAHDINNLLAAVSANTAMAKRLLSQHAGGAERYLDEITNAVDQVSLLSRKLIHREPVAREPIDLTALVRSTLGFLEASIPNTIRLRLELDGSRFVEGDASELRRLILNLVFNARQAIGDQPGTIRVGVGSYVLDRARMSDRWVGERLREGRHVSLSVGDDGCGMSDATKGRLFEKGSTTKPDGHGLGLASVLAITREHGGAIRVTSRENEGTLMEVCLPETSLHDEEMRPTMEGAVSAALVVDGQQAVRALAARSFTDLGLDVRAVPGPEEGERVLRDGTVDISVMLIDPAGFDRASLQSLLAALRQRSPEAHVIFTYDEECGGSSDDVQPLLDYVGEPCEVLLKPFRAEELVRALRIRSRSEIPPSGDV